MQQLLCFAGIVPRPLHTQILQGFYLYRVIFESNYLYAVHKNHPFDSKAGLRGYPAARVAHPRASGWDLQPGGCRSITGLLARRAEPSML